MEAKLNSESSTLQPQNRLMLKIISLMMLMSVVLLGGVLFLTGKWNNNTSLFQILLIQLEVKIMLGVGVVLLIVRTPLAHFLFKKSLQNPDKGTLLSAIFIFQIMRLALAEAAAVLGFQISLMYDESSSYMILGGAAIFAILRELPTEASLKVLEKMAQQAKVPTGSRPPRTSS